MSDKLFNLIPNFEQEHGRDAYGFALRPQHVQRYIEYTNIYKEEEEERSEKWKKFIEHQEDAQQNSAEEKVKELLHAEATKLNEETVSLKSEGIKAETTKLNERTVPDIDNEENKAEATKLIEDTISRSGSETDNSEDGKLEEEIFLERRRLNECENAETVSERSVEVDNAGAKNLKEETVSEKTVEVDNKAEATDLKVDTVSERGVKVEKAEATELKEETVCKRGSKGDDSSRNSDSDGSTKLDPKKEQLSKERKPHEVQRWAQIRPSLSSLESMMSFRVKRRKDLKGEQITKSEDHFPSIDEARLSEEESEEGIKEKFCVTETPNEKNLRSNTKSDPGNDVSPEPSFPWKELECLVRGGVPKDLRGEVWQAFVGVKARRVERYYQDLLAQDTNAGESKGHDNTSCVPMKWKRQIEKDIPRTFPGHPALNENGRDSLRRLLFAYALHNPSVGYCQAMNFFAGILLLLMPEENAFWTLVGIIDDYFDGYYTEEMVESQVDQLVFEELIHERFPKLVNHLDYLGVQVTWISGPWFLSIFVNMLPWETVLRVWDVLLYEGNRVMLFRTALALMELYGPALVTTKDAGDAITLLQSLAGSTFDSSQLVFTACMGYLTVTEAKLQELREKHRPSVLVVIEERSKGGQVWKGSKGLASKLYSFKHDRESVIKENKTTEELGGALSGKDISHMGPPSSTVDDLLSEATINSGVDSLPDLQEQVVWLKVELCSLLEEKRFAVLRAEELETALMEMVKQDNRRELSARIEQLEQEVAGLQQSLDDKKEQESAMLQVLLRVEQEQRVTEDARRTAEEDAAAQRYAVNVLQEKYEKAMASVAQMEKRVAVAESMLEATLQYESGQAKAVSTPGPMNNHGGPDDSPRRKLGLFGLGWRNRNKAE